jgi:hypothetical protein
LMGRDEAENTYEAAASPAFGGYAEPPKPNRARRTVGVVFGILAAVVVVAGVGGYLYWRSFRDTPQYSLALLVDAARRNDQQTVDRLVDTNTVVDDFLPQVTAKAVELYGRGQPPEVINRVAQIAQPLLPAVKDRARIELPRLIRAKTERMSGIPFAAMVMGADRYLDIRQTGDTATVKSKLPEHSFEVTMKRSGAEWKITGVRDEPLATNIARGIGQEIIAVAKAGPKGQKGGQGLGNVGELLRQAEEIFRTAQ